MKYLWPFILITGLGFGCAERDGASESGADKTGSHVWQAQENAYRKAQNVGPMLDEADQRQRQHLEQQGG